MNEIDFSSKLSEETFETMAEPFCAKLEAPLLEALEQAKIEPSALKAVEVIGGGSRVRCVRRKIAQVLQLDMDKHVL